MNDAAPAELEVLTIADITARWNVSRTTIHRRRTAGDLAADKDDTGRWIFALADVEAQRWEPKTRGLSTDSPRPEPTGTPGLVHDDVLELGELRARTEAQADDLDRIAAERDRARSDLEERTRELDLERERADAAERDAIEHRTRADAVTEHRDDLAERLDRAEERTRELDDRNADLAARLEAELRRRWWQRRKRQPAGPLED